MPHEARRDWLGRLERSRVKAIARGIASLRELVVASHREVSKGRGETGAGRHSFPGA
jgi:hypothetical protein